MIENRRYYRLPSQARFVLGNDKRVYSGKSTNISLGGAFVHMLDVTGIQSGDKFKCDFSLFEKSPVITGTVRIKRVAVGSINPSDYMGAGIEFLELSSEARRVLEEYIFEQKGLYEMLGTLLNNTEPDLRSMKPLISKLPIQKQIELRDLRMFVEATLNSIQLVEQKNG